MPLAWCPLCHIVVSEEHVAQELGQGGAGREEGTTCALRILQGWGLKQLAEEPLLCLILLAPSAPYCLPFTPLPSCL